MKARVIFFVAGMFFLCCLGSAEGEVVELPEWDGSRATPVHRIPIYDEEGQQIIPQDPHALPFSSRFSCGECHDYQTVMKGWHFNASRGEVDAGRPGEPWIWVDEETGTQIPLSYRGWKGTWHPSEIGLTPWKFNQLFGRHLPGGDPERPTGDEPVDYHSRWDVSGQAEINCMGCHGASPKQDPSEWAKQMERENFRWAATAAASLGDVGGMASRLPETWVVHDGPNPDDTEWAVTPNIRYNLNRFDNRNRAFFDVQHKPPDNNCLYCHSTHQIGLERWQRIEDVHTAAGIKCVDCHRNGLDHGMIRGYRTEAAERDTSAHQEFSCRGCHMGPFAGRLGAPRAEHRGLPPIHLEKMTCTACHSGLKPGPESKQKVRLSRIHRTGIHGRARWFTDLPEIVEPVLAPGADGRIAPHRAVWPAYWARVEGDKLIPIPPGDVVESGAGNYLNAPKKVVDILDALSGAEGLNGEAVLVNRGKIYRRNVSGELELAGTEPDESDYLWGLERDGSIMPLLETFVPVEEGGELESETRVLGILDALAGIHHAPGEPVMLHDGYIFQRGQHGVLEMQNSARDESAGPGDTIPAWGWGEPVTPLVADYVLDCIEATQGTPHVLAHQQVIEVLRLLGAAHGGGDMKDTGEYGYVSGGFLFTLDDQDPGLLRSTEHDAARPYLWPVAHDVRPAAQSLGAKGCVECHHPDAPFLFGTVTASGPLATSSVGIKPMHDFQGLDENFQDVLATSFRFRHAYKWFSWVAAVIISGVLLLTGLSGLRRLVFYVSRRGGNRG